MNETYGLKMSYAKKKKTKKKARVNVKVSHLLQLNSKKWIKLVQKIPRGSDASLIHVRST